MQHRYSLFELNEFIRQVMVLNFPDELWVSCELGQVNQSRGHFWLNLTEKDALTDTIAAKATAVLWRRSYLRLQEKLGTVLDSILQDGMQVLLQVQVNFHEAHGMTWIVKDIDPSYTMGQLEIKRQKTILELRKAELLEKNQKLPLPTVLQRIAVLSSATAAGLQDYLVQCRRNIYDYHISNQVFSAAMQGEMTEKEIRSRLAQIRSRRDEFDCVVIVRGGGARLDLSAFDGYELCRTIAEFPLPIFTGIGHDIDETVADMAAHTALKTPTAVADFILQHNARYEGEMQHLGRQINRLTARMMQQEHLSLRQTQQALHFAARQYLRDRKNELTGLARSLPVHLNYRLAAAARELDALEKSLQILSPAAAFKRGFSLTERDGKIITSVTEVKTGDILRTHLADGSTESKVE